MRQFGHRSSACCVAVSRRTGRVQITRDGGGVRLTAGRIIPRDKLPAIAEAADGAISLPLSRNRNCQPYIRDTLVRNTATPKRDQVRPSPIATPIIAAAIAALPGVSGMREAAESAIENTSAATLARETAHTSHRSPAPPHSSRPRSHCRLRSSSRHRAHGHQWTTSRVGSNH